MNDELNDDMTMPGGAGSVDDVAPEDADKEDEDDEGDDAKEDEEDDE